MSSLLAESGPQVLDSVSAALSEAAGDRLWAQSDTAILGRVQLALRVRAQADAVLLAAIGEADSRGLARRRAASSTRAWLTGAHQVDPAEAGTLVRTAASLRRGHEQTGTALAAGDVSPGQARVIIRSLDRLPTDLGPDLTAQAESLMVGHAEVFDPAALVQIGRRLAEVVDPWTQAHHITSWADGGPTDQNNGVLLCGYHHREIERGDWQVSIRGGRAWFTPPTWIDPDQIPLLNPMHHPPPLE